MGLLDNYVDIDVVKHFVSLIADVSSTPCKIALFGSDLWNVFSSYGLNSLLPDSVFLVDESNVGIPYGNKSFIDRIITFSKTENVILTVKEKYLALSGTNSTLKEQMDKGIDIRVVDNILGAMEVASRKRRNSVIYPIDGYEDEGLVTAAGLVKAKTVGFRNFFVFQQHRSMSGVVEAVALANNNVDGFIFPLKVGLNTGRGPFSSVPLIHNKGVVISGYEPMEIMQSIWLILNQKSEKRPAVVYVRTKELSDEVVTRSRWMLEEVFQPADIITGGSIGVIKNGAFNIKEKYRAFDAEAMSGI